MKLRDFVKMWTDDGFRLSKQTQKTIGKQKWVLYNVNVPYFASDYGRHMAIIVVIDRETGEILAHDEMNTSLRNYPNHPWTQVTFEWFETQVAQYGGKPIC